MNSKNIVRAKELIFLIESSETELKELNSYPDAPECSFRGQNYRVKIANREISISAITENKIKKCATECIEEELTELKKQFGKL